MEHGLIFERFLNEERISPPDIDIDFCENRRGEVIEYVTRKYGRENVAQIITFGTMKAKAVVRDVGRVLDMGYADVDKIAKMIPFDLKMTLDKALEESPQLKDAYEKDEKVRELIDISRRLEGTTRHASTHAAGVVIAPRPLTEFLPLASFKGGTEAITTQFDMHGVERIGLLKMDFLGLRTLTLIDDCVKMIAAQTGRRLQPDQLPLDDAKTYELFTAGKTSGLFQFESDGMRDILKRFKPDRLEHLTALNALYRPGPMQMIDDFIKRRHGQTRVSYDHALLEPILAGTYGVMVYQEQVMQIASALAGYTLGEADILRKAMGKKKADVMATQKDKFLKGCAASGVPEKKAQKIWDHMEQFAGYGFNKSHSAAYAWLAYQTGVLQGQPSRVLHGRAPDLGAREHRPDGELHRRVPRDGHRGPAPGRQRVRHLLHGGAAGDRRRHPLRAGRDQERGRGRGGGGAAGPARERAVPVAVRLLRAGGPARGEPAGGGELHQERLLRQPRPAAGRAAGRPRPRDGGRAEAPARPRGRPGQPDGPPRRRRRRRTPDGPAERVRDVADWPEGERLAYEKESLGFFITGHPLERVKAELAQLANATTGSSRTSPTARSRWAGSWSPCASSRPRRATGWRASPSRTSRAAAEVLVFPETYKKVQSRLADDAIVVVKGRAEAMDEGKSRLLASDVVPLDQARLAEARYVTIRVPVTAWDRAKGERLRDILGSHRGECPVTLEMVRPGGESVAVAPSAISACGPDPTMRAEVEGLLGPGSVVLARG